MIQGLPVLGTTLDLPRLVRELKIDHVIITLTQVSRPDLRQIIKLCEQIPVKVKILPALHEILQGEKMR